MRTRLKMLIEYLAKHKYKDSIAPRKAIASELKKELLEAGIPLEDHFLAVLNLFPSSS